MLSESIRIIRWLRSTGDAVRTGDAICEIEMDDASVEIPAWRDGILYPLVPAGAEVNLSSELAKIIPPDAKS